MCSINIKFCHQLIGDKINFKIITMRNVIFVPSNQNVFFYSNINYKFHIEILWRNLNI